MPIIKKMVLIVMATVAIVFLFEMLFRVIPFHKDAGATISGLVISDPELGWRLKPYAEGPLATNALGFRDTPYNPRADIVILLLGDSLSWGDGLGDIKKGYPFLLEKALSRETHRTVEVINAAVPGYSTFQQLRYLQLYGLDLNPDLVILQFCLNDVVERYVSCAAYGGDNVFLGIDTRQFIKGINGWLLKHSRLYEAAMRGVIGLCRDRKAYDVRKLAADTLSQELRSAWDQALSEIDGIHRLCQEKRVPLMIVAAPYRFQLHRPGKTDQPQKILRRYGREHHVPVVDLLYGFVAAGAKTNPALFLFNDANHFSRQGHELTAALLVKPVLRIITEMNL